MNQWITTGPVVGVVIAVLLVVLIIVIIVLFVIKIRRKRILYVVNESYQITGKNLVNPTFEQRKLEGSDPLTSAQGMANPHYDFASELSK